ncbi:MAG: hypothetical protein A2287_00460 [Candidatus Melainabacteria bacterium RIFOXYA12_FULL_32_12]|nr:MAG: hypothetical protein A2255_03300 [Candidatus Melainabacteria bacterium RIFOXYA2_FULL_32_9]OGI31367.1 MAG: hypothetical protein A2287_00460 [Candidatus Melainabacteria bacterium RIFOXYA12_FULL_32_12]
MPVNFSHIRPYYQPIKHYQQVKPSVVNSETAQYSELSPIINYNISNKININRVSFGSNGKLSALLPQEVVSLLPKQAMQEIDKAVPFETLTRVNDKNKIELNALGKELSAAIEGKLCQLGKLEQSKLNNYLLKGLDFDGTISLLVPKADDAIPLEGTLDNILAISTLPNMKVGIITGREVGDLLKRIENGKKLEELNKPDGNCAKKEDIETSIREFNNKVKENLFVSGLHGMQELVNGEVVTNISQNHKDKINILRENIEKFKSNSPKEDIKITLFEDKGCAIGFHYDANYSAQEKEAALKQVLGLIKESGILIVKPETNGNENLLKLMKDAGVKTIEKNEINESNKDSVFKLINGSGVLEIVSPSSNKGIIFEKIFNKYKESINNQLSKNPDAKILLSYTGDDTTDFEAFKMLQKLKERFKDKVEVNAILVKNNRETDLKDRIEEVKDIITIVPIQKNREFLASQNKVLSILDNYFKTL